MAARLLDGVAVANQIRAEVAPEVEAFRARVGRPPGLGIVLVGEDPGVGDLRPRQAEVRRRGGAAGGSRAPAGDGDACPQLLELVERLNRSDAHDGILVQSPLPEAMGPDAERRMFDAIRPDKDVDGFHPVNVGRLVQNRARLVPCTPAGRHRAARAIAGLQLPGAGRWSSDAATSSGSRWRCCCCTATRPSRSATRARRDLPAVAAEADILVSAIGRPAFVTREFVKPGATVIDVGITSLTDRATVERLFAAGSKRRETFERRGAITIGDVHPSVEQVAGAISPVPGGVGPADDRDAAEEHADGCDSSGREGQDRAGRAGGQGACGQAERAGSECSARRGIGVSSRRGWGPGASEMTC